ncbi:MAG: hypothetical protein JOZ17_06395 [Acetobacteraceae bacterium]|nr:hypothetical protein [Acetobacteraceae bacterium]
MKKLAFVASAAAALVWAASLIATPAASQQPYGPGPGYTAGPPHEPGGPVKSGDQCWSDRDPSANTGQGYWKPCAAAATTPTAGYGYGPGPGPGYAYGPGPGYTAGPPHVPGGPVRSGNMCWSDRDPSANTGQGYWKTC